MFYFAVPSSHGYGIRDDRSLFESRRDKAFAEKQIKSLEEDLQVSNQLNISRHDELRLFYGYMFWSINFSPLCCLVGV